MSLTNRHADSLSERQEMEVLKIGMQSSQGGDKRLWGPASFLSVLTFRLTIFAKVWRADL